MRDMYEQEEEHPLAQPRTPPMLRLYTSPQTDLPVSITSSPRLFSAATPALAPAQARHRAPMLHCHGKEATATSSHSTPHRSNSLPLTTPMLQQNEG
jgi:hypothetical protein